MFVKTFSEMIVNKTPKSLYPDPFASQSEKESHEYGIAYAEYIGQYWFSGGTITSNCRYSKRKAKIDRINTYKRGDVDPRQFAKLLDIDPDYSAKAFDTQVLSTAPKYINIAVDNVADSLYGVSVRGTDRYASENREAYKDAIRKEMLFKEYQKDFEAASGIEMPVQDDLPDDEDELSIREQLDFKTNYEIASEEGIKRVFELNNFDEISNQCIEDYVCHGEMVGKASYDNQLGVRIDYVDVSNFISSTNTDNTRNQKGVYYQGEVRQINIVELERRINKKLTKEEKEAIKGYDSNNYNGKGEYNYDSDFTVSVLDFAFKSTKEVVHKKRWNDRGGYRLIKKDADWNPPKGREKIKMSERYDTWYGGLHIIGSSLLFNYQELSYMTRDRGEQGRVLPVYIHYKSSTDSIGSRLEPLWKQFHILYMQMQRVTTSLKVGGFAYDIDAMVEIDMGNGKILKPHDLAKVHNESGNFYYSGQTMEGENIRIPITPLQSSDISSLNELRMQWNQYIEEANRLIGYNEYSMGTASLKGVGVGASQSALQSANTATKHIFNGWHSWVKGMAESVISRMQDAFLYGNINALLAPLIGKVNLEELQENYFIHKAQFSALVEVKPTQNERDIFLKRLEQAVQNGTLEPDDAAKVELDINNMKRAVQVMSTLKKKRRKEKQNAEQSNIQAQSQAKQAELASQAQAELAKIQAQSQADLMLEEKKQKGTLAALSFEWQMKMQAQTRELQSNTQNFRIKNSLEKEKQDRMDLRQAAGNEQLSKLNAQKNIDPTSSVPLEQEEKMKKQFEQYGS